ncbi:MAG: hypothetical protein K1060chlam2_00997 [Chlamydiae bacterium]|nr:hypothetical protein [Chlamydiota bacterium]
MNPLAPNSQRIVQQYQDLLLVTAEEDLLENQQTDLDTTQSSTIDSIYGSEEGSYEEAYLEESPIDYNSQHRNMLPTTSGERPLQSQHIGDNTKPPSAKVMAQLVSSHSEKAKQSNDSFDSHRLLPEFIQSPPAHLLKNILSGSIEVQYSSFHDIRGVTPRNLKTFQKRLSSLHISTESIHTDVFLNLNNFVENLGRRLQNREGVGISHHFEQVILPPIRSKLHRVSFSPLNGKRFSSKTRSTLHSTRIRKFFPNKLFFRVLAFKSITDRKTLDPKVRIQQESLSKLQNIIRSISIKDRLIVEMVQIFDLTKYRIQLYHHPATHKMTIALLVPMANKLSKMLHHITRRFKDLRKEALILAHTFKQL